jgi:hypothetical protein
MMRLGDIADVLAGTGVWGVIPAEWGYSPGAGGVPLSHLDPDDRDENGMVLDLLDIIGVDPLELAEPSLTAIRHMLHAGAVLHRVVTQCTLNGRDY